MLATLSLSLSLSLSVRTRTLYVADLPVVIVGSAAATKLQAANSRIQTNPNATISVFLRPRYAAPHRVAPRAVRSSSQLSAGSGYHVARPRVNTPTPKGGECPLLPFVARALPAFHCQSSSIESSTTFEIDTPLPFLSSFVSSSTSPSFLSFLSLSLSFAAPLPFLPLDIVHTYTVHFSFRIRLATRWFVSGRGFAYLFSLQRQEYFSKFVSFVNKRNLNNLFPLLCSNHRLGRWTKKRVGHS